MRNLNFLRKSERKSVGTTLALTVGSPSAHRRYSALKHLAFMLLFLLGSLNVWGATYKLTQVTSVSAGNKYVFVQSGHAMNATVTSSALQTTTSYNTTGLAGTEVYVWTLETATGGFYMKNVSLNSNQYLNNASSTNISFGNKSSIWTFTFTDGVALIQNKSNSSRFLGFTNATSYAYKAYSTQNMTSYAHDITVYVLEEEATGCDKKVNISAGTTTNGTFDLSKTGEAATCDAAVEVTVTPHPAEHFEVDKVTASNGGSVSGPDSEGKYTVTYAKDDNYSSEINVTFKQKAQYTVTWNVNGDESVTTQVYEGEKPEFPETQTSCDATSTTFIGWSTAPWEGKSANLDDKTVYTSANAMPAVTGVVTYYAVFAKVAGESGWIETAIGDLGASDVFVIVGDNGSTYAMTNDNGTSSAPGASAVTISDGKISGTPAETIKWNISGNSTDGYTFYPNGDSEKWLYCTNANNGVRVGTNDNKTFAIDGGYLKHSGTSRYVGIYNSQDWRCYTSNGGNIENQTFAFYKYTAGTASDYMTTCCTKYNITIADNIEHGSISADLAEACEGTTVTITFSPAGGYHLDSWSVNGTAQDVAASTFSMPAAAVEVSATFAHDDCENLAAPTLDAVTKNYNSATIAWNEVTDAEEYAVSVVNHATSASVFAGNVDALSKALADLEPETQYDYTIMAIGDGTVKCTDGNGVLEGNFTTDALPTAVLTLMENGNEVAGGSHAITVPFALPTGVTHTCGKTFVGWTSKSDFADGDEELSSYYEKGTEFTFENTNAVTLYAVYADEAPGAETPVTDNIDLTFTGVSGTSYVAWSESKTGTSGAVYTGVNAGGNNAIQFRSDVSDTKPASGIVSTTTGGKAKKVTIIWNSNTADGRTLNVFGSNTAYTAVADLVDDNNKGTLLGTVVKGTSTVLNITGNYQYIGVRSNSGAMYIDNVAIEWAQAGASTFDNYSITCAAAPTAEPASASIAVAAAGGEGTLGVSYENVNLAGVEVALFNNEACTEAFDGGWLTASIAGDDKHIAYNAQANTSYNDARTAYIKLTAPETNGAANPAVVVIPVEQAKKSAVFASLEDLVAANLASGTEVTVSFSNILITEVYTTNAGYRYGLYLNVKDKDGENDIELFYNKQGETEQVPDTWVKNGYVSATNLVTTWTEYKGQWELAMQGATWSWENGDITYGAPKAVSSVVVSGEPDKKAYVDGEKFNPAGLTVTVNYTVGDPEVIAVTDADWVYETSDVMALNQTSIKVKATYNTVTSENFYEVTDLTVNPISNKTIAQFIADEGGRCYLEGIVSGNINTTYGNFDLQDETGTIYVYGSDVFDGHGVALGDKVKVIAEEYLLYKKAGNPDKDEALNVVFVSKVSAATIAIDDINMTVDDELLLSDIEATITPDAAQSATINYEVTEGTAVTISEGKIIASTEGEATITASIAAGEGYLAGSTTFTVTVSPAPVPFEGDYFVKVDDNSKLTAGEYLIVYEDGSLAFNGGLGTLDATSNNVAVTFENGKIQGTAAVLDATFTVKLAGGTIQSKSGYYIGRTGNSNGMNTSTEDAYTNAISIDGNGDAVILASGGAYLRYNSTSGQERFRYFKSDSYTGQKAIQLYKKENAEPVYETVRTELEPNAYYTMCLDKAVTAVRGGSIWKVVSKAENGKDIILEDVEGTLDAGRPYIFYATAATLEVVYNGAAVGAPITTGNNGLIGSFTKEPIAQAATNYIIYNNELYVVNSDNVFVGAHRAYLNMEYVPDYNSGSAPAPGRRRISMAVHGEQVATGMEGVQPSEISNQKVLINGQLFILRGEKMYDATGRLVK